MRQIGLWCLGLGLAVGLSACGGRKSYTEKDVHEALAERQGQVNVEIERTVKSAPPPMEYTPPAANPQRTGSGSAAGGIAGAEPGNTLPPPTTSSPPPSTPMPSQGVGDVQLDPTTGQYGITPPGAPEGYTIPLDNR
ncbi:MAG: hypothetical protein SNJ72_02780 [Fimbriimonadales bacterium]